MIGWATNDGDLMHLAVTFTSRALFPALSLAFALGACGGGETNGAGGAGGTTGTTTTSSSTTTTGGSGGAGPVCGNGIKEVGEACDDGNTTTGDGCGACQQVAAVSAGTHHACVLITDGRLKCWGEGHSGALGLGDTQDWGAMPGEMLSLPAVDLGTGRTAVAVSAASNHTCAVLDAGDVKCWGENAQGELGIGTTEQRGDHGDMGDELPVVDLGAGARATAVATNYLQSCALLEDGGVKCWGRNDWGQLGLGDTTQRGDGPGEMGDALPEVDLGTGHTAKQIAMDGNTNCALLDDDSVKCWGVNGFGQLGQGDTLNRGDQPGQMGDALPAVDLGTGRTALAVAAHAGTVCAVLDTHEVKCWGLNDSGQLGQGDTLNRGDQPGQMGDALPALDLGSGRTAKAIAVGAMGACAILDDDSVKCWGSNGGGTLGLGDTLNRGDQPGQMGDALPAVDLGSGRTARAITRGTSVCALLDNLTVKCWGVNTHGELGQGDTLLRGNQPGQMGDDLPPVLLP